jgi:hypothetical protein
MTSAALTHISSFDPLTQEQRMQRACRTINGNGWRQRLAPLAEHMGNRRLVRARSDRGAALALRDLDRLREALMRLQRHDPVQAYLIVALAVENAPAAVVAADVGLDRAHLVGAPGKAVAVLALAYESVTFTSAVKKPNLGSAMRAAIRKERSRPTDRAVEASGTLGTAEGGSLTPSPESTAQRNTEGSRHILRIGIRPCTMTIHYITDG